MTKSTDIRALKNLNQPTRYSIPTVKGLHLWVRPDLKKYWVFRYTRNKSRHDICLGPFPEITLNDTKTKATKLRAMLLNGVDPATERKIQRQAVAEVTRSFSGAVVQLNFDLAYFSAPLRSARAALTALILRNLVTRRISLTSRCACFSFGNRKVSNLRCG